MSKMSRDKGARIEREIVAAHVGLGIKAERVPLSGASRYQGNGSDVDLYAFGPDGAPLVCEVKARASGEGFATLERWLGENDALFLRRDRTDPLVVLPWRVWVRLVSMGVKRGAANGR
jgi:Holliday junction resolvase